MSPSWGGKFSAMELENINIAFLTHIHSDHSAGLADLLLTPWIMGRNKELKLFGPSGLDKMAKEVEGKLKLQVPAGQANPSPPVGPALGQRGINIMDFCKVFNEKSKGEQPGVMLPVVVTYNTDKSFSIEIKLPPASFFIKEALKIKKGSKEPGRDMIATISMSQCKDIAEKKLKDLNANTVDQGLKIIIGSAKSMGIEVTN